MAAQGRDRARYYASLSLAGWTALTALAILAESGRARATLRDAAEQQAISVVDYLLVARRWNAGHGGVYVPVDATLEPSPYLANVPERDVRTPSGRTLTLMNPAWMTRQLLDVAARETPLWGRVTSLKPVRPENAPDPWERRALERLEGGLASFSEPVPEVDGDRLRYMRRLRVEESCLRCHAAQGYRVGDVRGGIAVSVPLAPFAAVARRDLQRQLAVHGGIWLLGVGGILVMLRDHRRRAAREAEAAARSAAEEAERAAARRLEAVGRLSAGVAHDFGNLLAPILTVSGLVRDELPSDSPLREDLQEIHAAAAKARDLVRTLQTLSRNDGGRPERLSLNVVVEDGGPLLRRFGGTRFAVELDAAVRAPVVLADRPLVELALANLVINAREGAVIGRTIRLSVGASDVDAGEAVRLHVRAGLHATVTVAEAGAERDLGGRVDGWAPVRPGAGAEAGGAGLGIPTINGIVAQYGGGVLVRPVGAAGWAVRLLLPAADAAA